MGQTQSTQLITSKRPWRIKTSKIEEDSLEVTAQVRRTFLAEIANFAYVRVHRTSWAEEDNLEVKRSLWIKIGRILEATGCDSNPQ